MLYILDTDSVSFQQAGRENTIRRLGYIPAESVHTTVITFYEQMRGRLAVVSRAKEKAELVRAYEQLHATLHYFSMVNVLPFTYAALQHLEKLRAEKSADRHSGFENCRNGAVCERHSGNKQPPGFWQGSGAWH